MARRQQWILWALLGVLAGGVTLAVYLALIIVEGNNPPSQVVIWSVIMALPCVATTIAMLQRGRVVTAWLLSFSAVTFFILGFITSLIVGMFPAAVLTGFAAFKHQEALRESGAEPARRA